MDATEGLLRLERELSGDGSSVRVRLGGEVDLSTAHHVEDALSSALDPRCTRLIVDANDHLRRLFELSGLSSAFTFEP